MDSRTVPERAQDIDLVEQMLSRVATPDEAAAARRILGVESEANRIALAYAPKSPPPAPVAEGFDYLTVAKESVVRYQRWVDSFPDDDPTPLPVRERTLRMAHLSTERLIGGIE